MCFGRSEYRQLKEHQLILSQSAEEGFMDEGQLLRASAMKTLSIHSIYKEGEDTLLEYGVHFVTWGKVGRNKTLQRLSSPRLGLHAGSEAGMRLILRRPVGLCAWKSMSPGTVSGGLRRRSPGHEVRQPIRKSPQCP